MRVCPSERARLLPQNKTCTECWSVEETVAAVNGVFVSPTVDLYNVKCQNKIATRGNYWFATGLIRKHVYSFIQVHCSTENIDLISGLYVTLLKTSATK